jgi:hypothetical protein
VIPELKRPRAARNSVGVTEKSSFMKLVLDLARSDGAGTWQAWPSPRVTIPDPPGDIVKGTAPVHEAELRLVGYALARVSRFSVVTNNDDSFWKLSHSAQP